MHITVICFFQHSIPIEIRVTNTAKDEFIYKDLNMIIYIISGIIIYFYLIKLN